MRLNKLISTNKEKKKLVDQYIRNVKIIEDAFDQIKEATGISSIDEIVTTFIKAEEQNYSLFNYVNRLGQETDQLEEVNKKTKIDIENFKKSQEADKIIYGDDGKIIYPLHIANMQKEIEYINDQIDKSNNEKDHFKDQLKEVQKYVEKMVRLFKKCKFFLSVANKMSYEDGTTFNEANVVQYLSELEEYISSLITYSAFRKEEPYAAISAIPLEKLNKKDFEKTKNTYEIPFSLSYEETAEAQLFEEERLTDPKKFFEKYAYHENMGHIKPAGKNTIKQIVNPNMNKNMES